VKPALSWPAMLIVVGCTGLGQAPVGAAESVQVVSPISAVQGSGFEQGPGCPSGMVRVSGQGTVGMRGQPYGIVHTRHLARVDAPEAGCSLAIAQTAGASTCWVQTDEIDPVLRPREVSVEDFCIEAFPFPGQGGNYTLDGLTAWGAERLDELLATGKYGSRRMCTASEWQLAVAGPTRNQRFVFGDKGDPGRCLGSQRIGTDGECRNRETGVHEYGAVHSHWTQADADFVLGACDKPPCRAAGNRQLKAGMYVVMGGTNRAQTRQAPLTPHTWHDHGDPMVGPCDNRGWDDQPAICATPSRGTDPPGDGEDAQAQSRAWAEFVAFARETGSMSQALQLGLQRSICK
jgi:hypothetical protein